MFGLDKITGAVGVLEDVVEGLGDLAEGDFQGALRNMADAAATTAVSTNPTLAAADQVFGLTDMLEDDA